MTLRRAVSLSTSKPDAPFLSGAFHPSCFFALTASPLLESTPTWRQASYEDFLRALRTACGAQRWRLELAPKFTLIADADASYLWSLRVDSKGSLYAAGAPCKGLPLWKAARQASHHLFESTDLVRSNAFDSKACFM